MTSKVKINYTREIHDFNNDFQNSYYTRKEAYEKLFKKNHGNIVLRIEYNNAKFKREFNRLSKVGTLEELQKKYQESYDSDIMQSIRIEMKIDKMSLFK